MFATIIQVLLLAGFGFAIYKVIGLVFKVFGTPGNKVKCRRCQHCELVDNDGVLCRYGETVTLKTFANVNMCQDFSPQ
jgi:hypothetical protein